MPTIRTSEFTVLQIVGLDAAVASTSLPQLAVLLTLMRPVVDLF